MRLSIVTLRSRVGTYHRGQSQGGAFCNSRMGVTVASERDIAAAAAHMFCEKCFPNGKPEGGAA
jgi:hypothetical protein